MTTTSALRRRARAAVVGLFVLVGALTFGPAAQAHDVLVGSDPDEGAVLDEAPESIVLTFNNAPLDVGSAITVVDADGATVAEAEGTVDGADVVFPLDELPAGELEVRWRVASSDGHPIEGVIPFSLDESAAEEPADEATTAEEPAPTTETAETAETTEPAAPATDDAAAESGVAGLPTAVQVVLGIVVLGAVAGLVVIVVKRLRSERG